MQRKVTTEFGKKPKVGTTSADRGDLKTSSAGESLPWLGCFQLDALTRDYSILSSALPLPSTRNMKDIYSYLQSGCGFEGHQLSKTILEKKQQQKEKWRSMWEKARAIHLYKSPELAWRLCASTCACVWSWRQVVSLSPPPLLLCRGVFEQHQMTHAETCGHSLHHLSDI